MARPIIVLLGAALVLAACGDDGGGTTEQPDTYMDLTPPTPADYPVTLSLSGSFEAGQTREYTVNGTTYEVTIDAAYLVVGNLTVLGAGDPVPAFDPTLETESPLGVGLRADSGYRVINLIESGTLGPIDVPEGIAGPIYFAILQADESAAPVDGLSGLPELADAMLLLEGSIALEGFFDNQMLFKLPGDQFVVLGAPGFELSGAEDIAVEVDLDNWFQDVDVTTLIHSSNTFLIDSDNNADAHALISDRAREALRTATITW